MRAQTTLDFLVGVSLFLLAVAVVVGMVPGMLDPFSLSDSAATGEANRAATALATDELGTLDRPYVLDASKVEVFFDPNETDVHERLRIDDDVTINVTLENDTGQYIESTGPEIPNEGSITTAWRTVSYGDEQATLRVRTW